MSISSRKILEDLVFHRLPQRAVEDLIDFVKHRDPILWGNEKPRGFLGLFVLVALYQDLYHKSFAVLARELRPLMKFSSRTFKVNIQKPVRIPAEVHDTRVRVDSTDFPLVKFKGYNKKSLDHSFKLNRPGGRRFMIVVDGKGVLRYLNDGFMLKTHDGTFLELHRESLVNLFSGAVFIDTTTSLEGRLFFTAPR
eukprot:gene5193-5721_t